jgi:hypothetical protein
MASLKTTYGVDTKAEVEGVWHTLRGGIRVRIARAGNPRASELTLKLIGEARERLRLPEGPLPGKEWDQILARVVAEAILLDWENVTNEADEPIPYSVEEGMKALLDPALHDFAREIDQLSGNRQHYALKQEEAALKNS